MPPEAWPEGFVAGPADREALLVLAHLDGVTPRRRFELGRREGTAARCLAAARRRRRAAGPEVPVDLHRTVAALAACGARHVCPGDREYPATLLDLPDPPASLFVRGRPLTEIRLAVAVVGARSCSPYGRELASSIGRGLSAEGVTVVSGAAVGIDGAAHRGALEGAGPEVAVPTLAVLGSGIDVLYPPRNRGLLERIAAVGTVVSEYPPGAPALPWRFPARNRLVAGLAGAVVVVEGAEGSGSMITADFSMELGREVLAVPGPVTSPASAVPHALIREGACLVRGPDDVLEALGLFSPGSSEEAAGGDRLPAGLSATERRVFEGVLGAAATVDSLAASSGLPVGEVVPALVALELRGLVREVAGRYERTGRVLG